MVDIQISSASPQKLSSDEESLAQDAEILGETESLPFSRDSSDFSSRLVKGEAKVLTTPAVRKLAKDYGVDISTILGTGPKGRIIKEDILALKNNNGAPRHGTVGKPISSPKSTDSSSQSQRAILPSSSKDMKVPIRGIQRMMVKSMNAALQVLHVGNLGYFSTKFALYLFRYST